MSSQTQWYYNISTKQAEQGKKSDSLQRLGPYASKEEAEAALERIAQRNEAADAYDKQYDDIED
ncbi:MAG: hypothetical protein Q3976_04290 [Corynebacterium sp.]|nr:hypothetical protein [Corynebacterium sp.]